MKNSFFLVIPEQHKNAEVLLTYEKIAVDQWVSELPTANPSLSTRLFYDFVHQFNQVEMPAQQRLDVLEALRPQFLIIEDYLRGRLMQSGFPKGENDTKILNLVVALEKNFTIGYWIVVKELTHRDIGWFKGKNTALAIQRTIKGLSALVVTHYMMFLPVPDWVWIDLHSLYKLSVKTKKESTKVADETGSLNKASSAEDCYKQILLLSLADPAGLMQKEIKQVYNFIGNIVHLVHIENTLVSHQDVQCIVLMDEDVHPYFDHGDGQADSSMMYLDFIKLFKAFDQKTKFTSKDEARFSSMHQLRNASEKLPTGLFEYIEQSWEGVELKGVSIFSDRLDRYIAIGLNATHSMQRILEVGVEPQAELLAESFSDRALSFRPNKDGVISIGSMVSFRKKNDPEEKRCLGVVKKLTMPKNEGTVVFEMTVLTAQSYSVNYSSLGSESMKPSEQLSETEEPEHGLHKALLYGSRDESGEKSFIIMESFSHKDGDILRMYMSDNDFPIILGNRKNIGLGYWQFECRQVEETSVVEETKTKGYDFI